MRDQELSKNRFENAWVCFEKTREKLKLPKKEVDIFKRNTFTVSKRFFGYGTEHRDEYEQKSKTHRHVVFTNRERVPRMNRVEDTLKLHSVIGTNERRTSAQGATEWKLLVAQNPCACLACRGKDEMSCPFENMRKEKEIWVHENTTPVQKRPPNKDHQAIFQQHEEELRAILEKPTGNISCKMIATELRLRNQPVSGRKHEIAERLVACCRNASSSPTTAAPENEPLAVTYGIVVDGDLDRVRTEEEEAEDIEQEGDIDDDDDDDDDDERRRLMVLASLK